MIDCDDCHTWFHASCVGLSEQNVPDQWFCSRCKIRQRIEEQMKTECVQNSRRGAFDGDQLSQYFLLLRLHFVFFQ